TSAPPVAEMVRLLTVLLKMLISVWKFVPFAPRAEPTTGMKISLPAASVPTAEPFGKTAEFTFSRNEHGRDRICCEKAELICVEPTMRPFTGVALEAIVTTDPDPSSCRELIGLLARALAEMS